MRLFLDLCLLINNALAIAFHLLVGVPFEPTIDPWGTGMCFSAKASFLASAALTICGVASMKKTKRLGSLAAIPLFFALQQAIEGIVWMTITHEYINTCVHIMAVYGFMFFASVWWPLYIPWALYKVEPQPKRKKLLVSALFMGICVATITATGLLLIGYTAAVVDHHIAYNWASAHAIPAPLYYAILCMYLYAVAGSFLMSTIRYCWVFGMLIIISCIIAQMGWPFVFGSLWCFAGAIGSIVMYIIVVSNEKSEKKYTHL